MLQLLGPIEGDVARRLDPGHRRALAVRALRHTVIAKKSFIQSLLGLLSLADYQAFMLS